MPYCSSCLLKMLVSFENGIEEQVGILPEHTANTLAAK